jgi:hypothetical protein
MKNKYRVTFYLRDKCFISELEFKKEYTQEELSIDIIHRRFIAAKQLTGYIEYDVVIIPTNMEFFKIEEIK